MLTPALYRTRITHLRRAPVHHYFEHRSYSWYVDVDQLPQLPRGCARSPASMPATTSTARPNDTLRQRIDAFLADRDIDLRGGTVTALLQARVLGYVFNPLSLYWCHDGDGVLRHVIAEVHNTYGGRHAYLLPPDSDQASMVMKKLYVSPFNDVEGYYLVRAPTAGFRHSTSPFRCTGRTSPHSSRPCEATGCGPASGRSSGCSLRHRWRR